ncbi:MAG: hypothetical protein LBD82_07215 [Deltaproteobacteria bacterium]|jgi:hypothetical protein|nr:hypothetical protein [Deltaproteobacteria bacterium]
MFFTGYRDQFISMPGLILSLLGLAYSLFMAFSPDAEILCLTSGCDIVRDFKIAGVSPWRLAVADFAVLAALCLLRLRSPAAMLAWLSLFVDCFFLLIMFFIAPCASCLVAALFIFLTWKSLRLEYDGLTRPRRRLAGALGAAWFILFAVNLSMAVNELIPAWVLPGQEQEGRKISLFFSPSCPACLEALRSFSGLAVLYPLEEKEEDHAMIAALALRTEAGEEPAAALEAILNARKTGGFSPPALSSAESLLLKIKTMRNQAMATRLGGKTVPLLVFEGLPASWTTPSAADSPQGGTPVDPLLPRGSDLPLDFGTTLECGRDAGKPCG